MITLPIIITYLGIGCIVATIYRAFRDHPIPLYEWFLAIVIWWGLVIIGIIILIAFILIDFKDLVENIKI